ncbi:hypothetical protein LTR66_014218 [Elasticomyces elasticus]|nr:hypothetical protein LTR66_014218 [Elasticomyces elasticus]
MPTQQKASPTPTPHQPLKATFFSLPRTLRNRIYRLVFVHPRKVQGIVVQSGRGIELNTAHQPALTRVNRRLQTEGLQVFFGENRFYVDLQRFLATDRVWTDRTVDWMLRTDVSNVRCITFKVWGRNCNHRNNFVVRMADTEGVLESHIHGEGEGSEDGPGTAVCCDIHNSQTQVLKILDDLHVGREREGLGIMDVAAVVNFFRRQGCIGGQEMGELSD